MNFVWNERKRESNLEKHGVDFADAIGSLLDPNCITHEDEDSDGEVRFVTLGMGFTCVIFVVVWNERGEDVRIISAREANRGERQSYAERLR